ncbi:hypothetical protein FNYG_07238 [Fusarium nygamai]|uniref:Uncharacterized protein n=1 Tax=Gibberella nygamai TaxID=42673 RepID=A0A2K0WAV9_GIBNY|nr:hypothetical protein FNYG_07238 [Fusarium nygamai]
MLAKYMVKGRNCNKVEQEGELGSPQEGTSSQKDQTEQQRDAAKHQERSKTSAGKKRSTGPAGHPNDEDDLNDPGKDGDTSRKRSKKRAKESENTSSGHTANGDANRDLNVLDVIPRSKLRMN